MQRCFMRHRFARLNALGRKTFLAFAVVLFGMLAAPAARAAAQGTVTIPGHVPAAIERSQRLGPTAPAEQIPLTLALQWRNPNELTNLLSRLYDPTDPLYGHYLTADQFAAEFAPTQADYARVIGFARSQGLTVTATTPNRLLVDVTGTAAQANAAFGVQLNDYRDAGGRVFHAPDREPSIPASLAGEITAIHGLSNAALARPLSLWQNSAADGVAPSQVGSGPGGALTPANIRSVYGLSSVYPTLTGSGQTLGVYELATYNSSDVASYEAYYGLPAVPLVNVVDGGGPGSGDPGADEVTLDIELQIALAPGATKILVYEGKNGSDNINLYNRIATDNLAKQISTSWGLDEASWGYAAASSEYLIFQQMAAQGQSIFAASGDSGAYDNGSTLSVDDPASQPFVTGTGGTTLSSLGAGGAWAGETSWGDPAGTTGPPGAYGGGGGASIFWSIPSYQQGVVSGASLGSTTMRNIPDVSIDANPNTGYSIYYKGGWWIYGGTSCAAPLWAAITALANQQLAVDGLAPLGFANPALYAIGQGPRYSTDFHDIADGSNNLYYPAVTGYDDSTGWGTPIGSSLVADLAPLSIAVPPAPTGLAANASNASVALSWTASTGAASYNVYRSTSSGSETLYHSGVTTTTYADTGVTNGTTYYYEVTAVDGGGESGKSNEASATPQVSVPAAPTNLVATAGNAQVGLSWTGSSGATTYNVYRSTSSGAETLYHSGVTGTSYTDTGLTNGTTYYYKVTAVNTGGESGKSNEANATPQVPAPPAPGNLVATAGNGQVGLSWSSSAGAMSYNVYRGASSGGETLYQTGVTVTTFTDTAVTNGTTYYYKVVAVNAGGTSGFSNEASAKPTAPSVPPAPTGLVASANGRQINLSWAGSAGATSYSVYRGKSSGSETLYASGVTSTTYSDRSIVAGTTYYYKVAAVNTYGTSPLSNEASAKAKK